ncbi:MAG: biotin/lipoyl-binding protein [Propioniciclava sp.]|uniref:biotin/lipoyl-binding protein n=1 Tax=Propioniciclava sp. TaxID=2038686 RepID=UPI0039E23A87
MKRTRLIAAAIGVVVLALATWALWPRPSASAAYVTAPAARGSVTQTLTLVGPVTRTGQAAASFGTNGLVTAVNVRVGDHVDAGQQLATLDPAPLRLAVLRARADVAGAEAQLDANLTAQRAGTGSTPGAGGLGGSGLGGSGGSSGLGGAGLGGLLGGLGGLPSSAPSSGGKPSAGGSGVGGLAGLGAGLDRPAYLAGMESALTELQAAVGEQQTQCTPVFSALSQLKELRDGLPTVVPTALPSGWPSALPTSLPSTLPTSLPSTLPTSPPSTGRTALPSTPYASAATPPAETPDTSPPAGASPSASVSPGPKPSTPPGPTPSASIPGIPEELLDQLVGMADQVQACSDAMVGLAQAEAKAGQAIITATQGMAASTQQIAAALAAAQAEIEQAAREASEQVLREAQAQLEKQLAALGGSVTDATIAGNRAQLLQARQQLETAEANLAGATLASPISGTVGALDLVTGENSSGRSATIVGEGAAQVTVQVPLAHRGSVVPGMAARAGNLAASTSLGARVSQVSVLPTGEGTPTFATEVLADDPAGTIPSGAYAEVTLELGQAKDVLTVPASAVTKLTDTTATVEVVTNARDQEATTTMVVTGRFGQGRVEIVSGLAEGQLVALADRRLPVPGGIGQYQPARAASPAPARR